MADFAPGTRVQWCPYPEARDPEWRDRSTTGIFMGLSRRGLAVVDQDRNGLVVELAPELLNLCEAETGARGRTDG